MRTGNVSRIIALTPPFARNPLWLQARSLPSLDLDFASTKSLIDRISGQNLITFTRASSATVVGPTGLIETVANDVPRFQHDPTTGACLGFLPEEQRSNLLVRSEEFDNASWTKSGLLAFGSGSTANSIAAPSGAVTADLLTEDTATAEHFTEQNFSASSGTTYAFSVFAKAGTNKTTLLLRLTTAAWSGGANNQVRFNLSNGAATVLVGSPVAFSQNVGNGWWRFTIVSTASSTGAPAARIHLTDSSGNTSYTGDGASGIYLWGAQLEAGAFPTSYIPTTGTSATRSADIATIPAGVNFSSWYNQSQGSFFASLLAGNTGAGIAVASADDNTPNNRCQLRLNVSRGNVRVVVGGVSQHDMVTPNTLAANIVGSIAMGYQDSAFVTAAGGQAPATAATGTVPTVTQLSIGSGPGSLTANGPISRITYWPTRLPNSTLQALTR
jgi:hypothetical protein